MDINEGLETEQGLCINPGTAEVDDQSAKEGKANIQEEKYMVELDPNRNLEMVQDHLNEVYESRKFERTSEKSSLEAKKFCPDVRYDIENKTVQEIHFGNIVPSNMVAGPCEPAPESLGSQGARFIFFRFYFLFFFSQVMFSI